MLFGGGVCCLVECAVWWSVLFGGGVCSLVEECAVWWGVCCLHALSEDTHPSLHFILAITYCKKGKHNIHVGYCPT